MGCLFQLLGMFGGLIWKLCKFTGLHITVIACVLMLIVEEGILKIHPKGGEPLDYVNWGILIISVIPIPFITIGNLIRLFKPDFSFIDVMNGFNGKGTRTYEKVDKSLVGLESGVVLGKMQRSYITMSESSEGCVMVLGGQGSGKSTSVAIPTLLNYNNSVFAIDIKGELSKESKNYRKNMKIFDPINEHSPHYNPYEVLDNADNRVQGAREIVNSLIPMGQEKDPYWKQSAQNLMTASILHFYNEDYDFPTTCRAILNIPVKELVQSLGDSPVNEARMFVNQFIGADDKQLASIYSTLANNIILFATDKDIMRVLSKDNNSDTVSSKDLDNHIDVFVKINEDKLEQWKLLLNLMVNQFLKSFEKREDKNKNKILFMIDEFARLGKIETMANGFGTLRSKGIQIMIILQSLAQLDSIYGKEVRKIIADNCNYKVVLNANDVDTQEYFSKLVGTEERRKVSNSISSNSMSMGENKGINKSTEEKRIIRPEEFAYLENPVVFTPKGFFRPKKIKWYEDKIFIERAGYKELA